MTTTTTHTPPSMVLSARLRMVRKINSNQGMEENHFQKAKAIDRQSLSQAMQMYLYTARALSRCVFMICIIVPLPSLAHDRRPRRQLGFPAKSHDYEVFLGIEQVFGNHNLQKENLMQINQPSSELQSSSLKPLFKFWVPNLTYYYLHKCFRGRKVVEAGHLRDYRAFSNDIWGTLRTSGHVTLLDPHAQVSS